MEGAIQEIATLWSGLVQLLAFDSARLREPEMMVRLVVQCLLLIASAFFSSVDGSAINVQATGDAERSGALVVENQPVDEILGELQRHGNHMAIVVDEFGSAVGMVTLEDVLERVVGEVVNVGYAFEAHVPRRRGSIEALGKERYRIDGRTLISEVCEILGVSFAYPNVHTIGGLVVSQLRHLPRVGESVVISGYRFTVEGISEKGVKSILAELL